MNRTRILTASVGTLLVGAASVFAPMASAGNNVGWSVSIGAPGFAVTAGQPAWGGYGQVGRPYYSAPYRPYYRPNYRPVVVAPPVAYRPWYAPVVAPAPYPYYAPRAVVYAPPVVVSPRYAPVRYPVAPRYYGY
jgi:hypothetical protein